MNPKTRKAVLNFAVISGTSIAVTGLVPFGGSMLLGIAVVAGLLSIWAAVEGAIEALNTVNKK